ncbi:hypothetical protein AB0J01_28075 [Streptomyces sp. NPDC050204]|uniref:hypothetical protein n=1 Tax=Streptomyces sp. NPDC050204 TaxID=3155514 RepID=UPI003425A5B3
MEAEHVFRMALLRAHDYTSRDVLMQAAKKAGEKARQRVAQEILAEFLAELGRTRASRVGPAPERVPWSERCAELLRSEE